MICVKGIKTQIEPCFKRKYYIVVSTGIIIIRDHATKAIWDIVKISAFVKHYIKRCRFFCILYIYIFICKH